MQALERSVRENARDLVKQSRGGERPTFQRLQELISPTDGVELDRNRIYDIIGVSLASHFDDPVEEQRRAEEAQRANERTSRRSREATRDTNRVVTHSRSECTLTLEERAGALETRVTSSGRRVTCMCSKRAGNGYCVVLYVESTA